MKCWQIELYDKNKNGCIYSSFMFNQCSDHSKYAEKYTRKKYFFQRIHSNLKIRLCL